MKTAEDIINDKSANIVSVPPGTLITDALKIMLQKKVGAVVIMDGAKPCGIWTERDLMRNVTSKGFNIDTAVIDNYAVTQLHFAKHSDSIFILMDKFLGLHIRHLLIKREDVFLGILSSGDVLKYGLREKFEELQAHHHEVSWEYYEEWKWNPKEARQK